MGLMDYKYILDKLAYISHSGTVLQSNGYMFGRNIEIMKPYKKL